jgi:tetratricopeptide (TPR) repeat protein
MVLGRVFIAGLVCLFAVSCSKDAEIAKREHAQNGDRYVADGKFKEAIIEYRQAVALDDRFGEARLKLADAYMQINEPQRALREYIRAADLLDDAEAHIKAGRLLLVAGSFEDAKTRADQALARSAGNVEALMLKGGALAGLRDLPAAVAEVEAAIAADPTQAENYSALATLQQAQGDTALAEKSFLDGIKSDPKSASARLALANFYFRTRRTDDANREIRAALDLAPDDEFTNRFAAAFYMASGRVTEAEQPLKMVAERSTAVEDKLRLADYYLRTKRLAEARQVYAQVASERTGSTASKIGLARVATAEGDTATAERYLDEALQEEPRHVDALVRKTELRLAAGNLEEALASARRAVAADRNSARANFTLGRALARGRDGEGAEVAYQEALRLDPRMQAAAVELARVQLALGKADHAVQLAESTLKSAPGNPDAQLLLVRGQMRLGRVDAAEKALRSLAAAFPDAPAVNVELGRLLTTKGDPSRARQAFERALAGNPGDVGAIQGLTLLDTREKKHAAARTRIDQAIAIRPESSDLRLLSGRLHSAVQESVAAEQAFKRAVALDPNNIRAFTALAGFYTQEKRLPEATTELEKMIALRPSDVGARTALGVLLEIQGKSDDARQRYSEALEINPRAAVAANNLAWMYAERGEKLDLALQLARVAKAELPDVADVNDTLGWVYYKSNMPALAIDPLREAIKQDATNASYHLHLGLAYSKTGEPEKARDSISRALSLDPNVAGTEEARAALALVGQR